MAEGNNQVGGRLRGRCKVWAESHGFIQRDDGESDVYVHQTQIQKRGYRSLRVGELVEFELKIKPDGRKQAVRVTGPSRVGIIGKEKSPGSHYTTDDGGIFILNESLRATPFQEQPRRMKKEQRKIYHQSVYNALPTGRLSGICKSWCNGYGFIKRNDGGRDVFVHHMQIKKRGFRSLRPGELVEFELQTKVNGRQQAVRVTCFGGGSVVGKERLEGDVTGPQPSYINSNSSYEQELEDLYSLDHPQLSSENVSSQMHSYGTPSVDADTYIYPLSRLDYPDSPEIESSVLWVQPTPIDSEVLAGFYRSPLSQTSGIYQYF